MRRLQPIWIIQRWLIRFTQEISHIQLIWVRVPWTWWTQIFIIIIVILEKVILRFFFFRFHLLIRMEKFRPFFLIEILKSRFFKRTRLLLFHFLVAQKILVVFTKTSLDILKTFSQSYCNFFVCSYTQVLFLKDWVFIPYVMEHFGCCKSWNNVPVSSMTIKNTENFNLPIDYSEKVILVFGVVFSFLALKLNIFILIENLLAVSHEMCSHLFFF